MMMLKKIPVALLLLCFATTSAQKRTNLDKGWKFHFGNAADPNKDFDYGNMLLFHKSNVFDTAVVNLKFNDKDWDDVDVPHDWAVALPFVESGTHAMDSHGYKPVGAAYPETSIGWYRKHFSVDKNDLGKRFEIQFDGIYRNAAIWVNGFYTATLFSGYVGDAYDISDYVNFDGDNLIVVRVDATQAEGWFYEGAGIYRHVWLNVSDKLHIPTGGQFVHAEVDGNTATVHIETEVENKNLTPADCSVYAVITDRSGKTISRTKEEKLSLAVNETGKAEQALTLDKPHLWALDDPYLYKIVSVVKKGNDIVYKKQSRFGIRSLAFDAQKGFFLNGKPIKIQGTNNHQDHAGVGNALPDALQYYRIRQLKKLGSNAYRTSHNAPTAELLDACDSLGMLVLDEQRLLNSSPEYVDQFKRLIRRDRNHPSVFLWSIGNEEQNIQGNEYGKRIAQSLLAIQKQLDPTRTSTYAADMGNDFKGVNEVIPIRGFNYRQFAVADYHRDHPDQPVIGTEMGSTVTTRGIYEKDTVQCYVPDQDITSPWWASKAEDWWKPAAENDYWLGGFVWTGFDYRGEPTPYKWPNINSHFGVMDVCGFPKNIYYYYQSWWTDKDVLHISPHWNWPDKIGQPIEVWVNSNADNVELFLNGKSLGKKNMPRNSHLTWNVVYQPGKLEAVAYKKGRKLTASVETTGKAAKIVVTPDETVMLADGRDADVINISITDDKGREVPDANNMLHFTITGDAKIIGVGNGDPSSHEPDKCGDGVWQRSAFNGKCQVIIQSGTSKSTIKLEARAEGLKTGTATIESK